MSEEVFFNIKPYKSMSFLGMIYNRSDGSWRNMVTKEIFIYYHENKPEKLAWKILIFDVDHECLHEILSKFIDSNTSRRLDSMIGLKLSEYLYSTLFEEYRNNGKGNIMYKENGIRKEYK